LGSKLPSQFIFRSQGSERGVCVTTPRATRRPSVVTEGSDNSIESARDADDDPPMSDELDAALAHLVETEQNIDDANGELDPL